MATKQLTNSINRKFFPTTFNLPMLGFGDFLKDSALLYGDYMFSAFGGKDMISDDMYSNKGFRKASNIISPISQIGGQVAASVALPGVGNQAMAGLQQGVGNVVPDKTAIAQEDKNKIAMLEEQQKQLMLQQLNNGMLNSYAGGGGLNFKSPAAYKAWLAYGHASGEFAKTPGHQKVSIKGQPKKVQHAMGGSLDNVTNYATGGFHETNPNGGIPLGDRALVEEGEVRYNSKKFGDYIFSNRF